MQAVGSEVIVALLIPVLVIGATLAYNWRSVKQFIHEQFSGDVRIEENEQQRRRRQEHVNDQTCSICLQQPKKYPVSSTCGHSFCSECIFSLHHHLHQKIKCPLCRLEVNILFKLFESSDQTREIEQQLRNYNMRFDDNRPLLRRITELPYVLQRIKRFVCSGQFILYFFRSVQIFRMLSIIIVYVLMPFDLIPESVVGIIGYIDDIMIILLIVTVFVTAVAIQYMRSNAHQI